MFATLATFVLVFFFVPYIFISNMPLFFNMVSSVFLQYWFCLPVISESRHRHFVPVTLPRLQTIGLEFYQNSLACMCRKYSIGLRTGHSIFLLLHRADETQPAQYSCPTLILAFTSSKDQGKTLSSPCKCFPQDIPLKVIFGHGTQFIFGRYSHYACTEHSTSSKPPDTKWRECHLCFDFQKKFY